MDVEKLKLAVSASVFAAEAEALLQDLMEGRIIEPSEVEFTERLAIYLSGRAFVLGQMSKGMNEQEAIAALAGTLTEIEEMTEEELDAALASL